MKTVHNGENEVLILEAPELRDIEKRAAMAAKLDDGVTVVAGVYSLYKPAGASAITMTVAGAEHSVAKSPADILQIIAEYKTPDRVLAVLAQ